MKQKCEVCKGKGYVELDEFSNPNPRGWIGEGECPYCDGTGFAEFDAKTEDD